MPVNLLSRIPKVALVAGTLSTRVAQQDAVAICQGTGGFKCVSQFYFTLCNGENSVAQMVATGTQCVNDQIVSLSGPAAGNFTNGTFPSTTTSLNDLETPSEASVITTVTATNSAGTSSSSDDTDDSDGDLDDDEDVPSGSSPKAPFPAGNSTSVIGTGTPMPFFPKTLLTQTSTQVDSAPTVLSSESTSDSDILPAVTTPATGVPECAPSCVPTAITSGFSTVTVKNSPDQSDELEVIPVTGLR